MDGVGRRPGTSSLRRGDASDSEREFERLYLESYGFVYNYVRYRMNDPSAVEDVVADAFMRAARAFHTFDPSRAKFSTWVMKIAINCMNSYYRSLHLVDAIEDVPDKAVAVPSEEEAVCDRDLVDRLLSVLDPTERQLVFMKYQEGKRNVDIAEELDMNASTVSTKLANAMKKMRSAADGVA